MDCAIERVNYEPLYELPPNLQFGFAQQLRAWFIFICG